MLILPHELSNKIIADTFSEPAIRYTTRNGNIVIIISKKNGGIAPWIGYYYTSDKADGEWVPCSWNNQGLFVSLNGKNLKTGLDLVDVEISSKA